MIARMIPILGVLLTTAASAQTAPDVKEHTFDSGEKIRFLIGETDRKEGVSVLIGLPPGDQSEKPALLAYESYWKSLKESGWVVVVPILSGYSESERDSRVAALCSALPEWFGDAGHKPHLAGVSSGGRMAYRVATQLTSDRLSSLVLIPGCATTDAELERAFALKDLEVRMFVGGEDDPSWKSAADTTFRALREADANVKLMIRENEGHVLRITSAEFRNMMEELKAAGAPAPGEAMAREAAAVAVLDDFHLAASQADGERYFSHFAPDGVFLGTDATERWNVEQFRAYATPYFSQGKGWTYIVKSRHLTISEEGRHAWFDEALENEKYGECRGSGVLVKISNVWKIAQYNLTVPIPNELLADVAKEIRQQAAPK